MRRVRTLSLALGFLALVVVPVSGQQVAGTWVLSVDLGGAGAGDATFVLMQEGTTITGTYTGAMGEGIEVTGTAEDGVVKLSFESDLAGVITYEGMIEGNVMKGTCVYGDLGEGTFEGSRAT